MTADPDATLPPLRTLSGRVCPRCRKSAPEDEAPPSGRPQRCPKHDLAYVEVKALEEASDSSMLGVTVGGRFTIQSQLGKGSMGAVYRARQDAVGRDVALKIVRRDRAYDPETRARFEREARATSALTSPHTVTAFDFGEAEDGSWYLAMELLDGETLGQRLKRTGAMPWREAVTMVRDALLSLGEAHAKGIIHRDLKPDNLFLCRVDAPRGEGRQSEYSLCKVLDFGIAKLLDEQRVDSLETQAGTVFGTPRYMSPEQAQGRTLDGRSDIYSLGVLLYHALAGRPPFVDDDAVVVMAQHIKTQPPPVAEVAPQTEVPARLEEVLMAALAKDPAERPQSAEEFDQVLAAVERSADAAAQPGTTGPHSVSWAGPAPQPRATGLPRVAVLLGGTFLVGLLILGVVFVFAEPASGGAEDGAMTSSSEGRAVAASVSDRDSVAADAPSSAAAGAAKADRTPVETPAASAAASASARPKPGPVPAGVRRKAGDRYGRFE